MSGTLAGMTDSGGIPAEVEVWFQGGPAAGAIRMMPLGPGGALPPLVMLRGGEVFVGSRDDPAAVELPTYELTVACPRDGQPPLWLYVHVGTLEG